MATGPIRRRVAAIIAGACLVATACGPPPSAPDPAPLRAGQAPLRVMVVGDSFGLSVGLGLTHYGESSGQIEVRNSAFIGCPFGRGGRNNGIGLDRDWLPECRSQDERLATVSAEFRPDVVLLAGGMWDVADRLLPGSGRWTRIGEPAYDWYLALEFQHLSRLLGTTGAKVVWTTAPRWNPRYQPDQFMGRPPYAEAGAGRSDRYNQVLNAAVGGMPGVNVLDLAGWMRYFPGGEFSPDLRTDGVHLTPQSTDVVASEFLGPWVVAIGRS
ncbi:MAG: SGNH/GDSL hydrolase family protein [Microthrixaceae bacterium]